MVSSNNLSNTFNDDLSQSSLRNAGGRRYQQNKHHHHFEKEPHFRGNESHSGQCDDHYHRIEKSKRALPQNNSHHFHHSPKGELKQAKEQNQLGNSPFDVILDLLSDDEPPVDDFVNPNIFDEDLVFEEDEYLNTPAVKNSTEKTSTLMRPTLSPRRNPYFSGWKNQEEQVMHPDVVPSHARDPVQRTVGISSQQHKEDVPKAWLDPVNIFDERNSNGDQNDEVSAANVSTPESDPQAISSYGTDLNVPFRESMPVTSAYFQGPSAVLKTGLDDDETRRVISPIQRDYSYDSDLSGNQQYFESSKEAAPLSSMYPPTPIVSSGSAVRLRPDLSNPSSPQEHAFLSKAKSQKGKDHANIIKERWWENFHSLQKFYEDHGHCNVPARYKPDRKLGNWVMTQRRQYQLFLKHKRSSMTIERVESLQNLGFNFTARMDNDDIWELRFNDLKEFKKIHKHCHVPQRYATNKKLGTWVNTQRTHYHLMLKNKRSCMTQARIQMLESVGFVWCVSKRRSCSDSGADEE